MPYLDVCAVEKSFVTPRGLTHVLGGASLSLEEGEFVAIVGYSGSGKTTLISLIAGLLAPDAGTIVLDGEAVREPGPERGIVFQQYSLLPWMTTRGTSRWPWRRWTERCPGPSVTGAPTSSSRWSGSRRPPPSARASCQGGCASAWPSRAGWPCGPKSC